MIIKVKSVDEESRYSRKSKNRTNQIIWMNQNECLIYNAAKVWVYQKWYLFKIQIWLRDLKVQHKKN